MKTKIIQLTETMLKVYIGSRVESVYRGIRSGRWVATFNGIAREFKTKAEAIVYATGTK